MIATIHITSPETDTLSTDPLLSICSSLCPRRADEVRRILMRPIQYVDHRLFHEPAARRRIFDRAVRLPEPRDPRYGRPVGPSSPLRPGRMPVLSPDEERLAFLRYNYARFRAARAQSQLLRLGPGRRIARELVKWHRLSVRLRNRIVRFNLALVLMIAGRFRRDDADSLDLVGEGNLALIRAAEAFDVSRGLKFSTYAWTAVIRSLRRNCTVEGKRHQRFGVAYNPELEHGDYVAEQRESCEMSFAGEVARIVRQNQAELTDLEQAVIRYRFGLGGGPEMTLGQVSSHLGRSRERVRQIQNQAMEKIRRRLQETYIERPSAHIPEADAA